MNRENNKTIESRKERDQECRIEQGRPKRWFHVPHASVIRIVISCRSFDTLQPDLRSYCCRTLSSRNYSTMSTGATSISSLPTTVDPEEMGDLESSLKKSEKLFSEADPSQINLKPASNPTNFPSLPPGLVLTLIEGSTRLLLKFDCVPLHPLDPLAMSRGLKIWMTLFSAVLVMSASLYSSSVLWMRVAHHECFDRPR